MTKGKRQRKREAFVRDASRKAVARPQPPMQDSRVEVRERRGASKRRAIAEQDDD